MDPENLSGKFPWTTKEGFFDPAQFPIDGVLKQALSDDDQQFRSGLNLLGSMYRHGRQEAGVLLSGLLVTCEDDWERRTRIVEVPSSNPSCHVSQTLLPCARTDQPQP